MMVSKIFDFRIPHKNAIFMMEVKAKTKKWGNSIGIIIPKDLVKKNNLKPDQEVTIMISAKPFTKGADIWGTMKFKKSTSALMRQVDKDLDFGF